jgi:signal transduction histidine kinase
MTLKNRENCEDRLRKLNEEFEQFTYIVSHDLKAPVRAVSNLAVWIEEDLEGNLPGDSAHNFKLLKNRLGRLETMIEALLTLSRVTRLELDIYPVEVSEIIQSLARKQNKPVKLNIEGSLPEFDTYGTKLAFVLNQLLKNATDFNDKTEPEINITLQDQNDFVQITIADNGPGIPETSLPKIFTMFYTAQSKDALETTGAGLAIADKIVNFVGGELQAANLPGSGAVFTVTWPKIL